MTLSGTENGSLPSDCIPLPVLVIFGPTASGKTALADSLFGLPETGKEAGPFAGRAEIVSADSMQVYTGMDIGTAKPDRCLRSRLPHHIIDVCDPGRQFTAGDFVRLADSACADIFRRGKLPVVLGGTAFYIRNFLYGLPSAPEADSGIRSRLRAEMRTKGAEEMHRRLGEADPAAAEKIHVNDEYRILRALEVCSASGRPLSSFSVPDRMRPEYRFCIIGLECEREQLYRRIDDRVARMFRQGLAEEFFSLLDSGYGADAPGMNAIGYREFFMAGTRECPVSPGDAGMDAVRELVARDSRRYAKRQMTFFRSVRETEWIRADDTAGICAKVAGFFRTAFP